jgi:FG-GAP repeat
MRSVKVLLAAGLVAGAGMLSAAVAFAASQPAATAGPTGKLLATLKDPAASRVGAFGVSVAVSGATAVVGSFATNGTKAAVGTAYIYAKSGNRWQAAPAAVLHDPPGAGGDEFGISVAVSGGTVVVGASGTRHGSGAAYVYTKGTAGWPTTPTATLNDPASTRRVSDGFGISVAVSGGTVVVGASGTRHGSGAAYIYTRGTAGWPATPAVRLNDPPAARGGSFGYSTAISGGTVVVGAPGTSAEPGAAFIYAEGTAGWPTAPTVSLPGPARVNGDGFGYSAAVSGGTAVIGAANVSNDTGHAYIYTEGTAGWPVARTITLNDPASATGDLFGSSVAVSGGRVVVGAPGSSAAGNAYVYAISTAGWPAAPTTVLRHPAGTATFGYATAADGTTALVGEPNVAAGPGAALYQV